VTSYLGGKSSHVGVHARLFYHIACYYFEIVGGLAIVILSFRVSCIAVSTYQIRTC
jgi:hypothetical protein